MGGSDTAALAEQRLNEILATTLDEVAEAEELERERVQRVRLACRPGGQQGEKAEQGPASHWWCVRTAGIPGDKGDTQHQVHRGGAAHPGTRERLPCGWRAERTSHR
jgi:hypothetical protein